MRRLLGGLIAAGTAVLVMALPAAAAVNPLARFGGHITYVARDGSLVVADVASGTRSTLVRGGGLLIAEPTWSPDGTQVAYLMSPALNYAGRNDDLFTVPTTGGSPRKVTRLNRPLHDLAWYPDSQRLLFSTGFNNGGFQTHVVVLGGDVLDFPLPDGQPDAAQFSPKLSPDGRHIAFLLNTSINGAGSTATLVVTDETGGNPVSVAQLPNGVTNVALAWRPDGQVLGYAIGSTVYEVTPDGSITYPLFDANTNVLALAYAADGNTLALCVENGSYPSTPNSFLLTRQNLMVARRDGTPVSLGPQGLLLERWVKMTFAPDGNAVLLVGKDQRDGITSLWVVDTPTARAELVEANVGDYAWRP